MLSCGSGFFFFFSLGGATYCLCRDGISDQNLQKALDYACGAGADCSPILQSGACYQPNTVKDHCNYAVNSYFQKKGQATGTCDFAGSATTSSNPPSSEFFSFFLFFFLIKNLVNFFFFFFTYWFLFYFIFLGDS